MSDRRGQPRVQVRPEVAAEVVRRYKAEDPVQAIADDLGLNRYLVYRVLDARSVPRRPTRQRRPNGSAVRVLHVVDRALQILCAVGAAEAGLTRAGMAAVSGVPAGTVQHHVTTLESAGMLRRWPGGRYTLGPVVGDLARGLLLQIDERVQAGASRQEVAAALGRPLEWVDTFLEAR